MQIYIATTSEGLVQRNCELNSVETTGKTVQLVQHLTCMQESQCSRELNSNWWHSIAYYQLLD